MIKQKLLILLILTLKIVSISAQKKYNFIIKVSPQLLTPKSKVFSVKGGDSYYHSYLYDLKISPYRSYGLDIVVGNEFRLKKIKKLWLYLPIHLQYKYFEIRQKQIGEYGGGYAFQYFNGTRELTTSYNIVALSAGLNVIHTDSTTGKEWDFATTISANLSIRNTVHIIETPVNCPTCQSQNLKYSNKDFTMFPCIDLSIARLYKIKKLKLGYSVGYIYNIPPKLSYYNISLNNLNDYNLFEIGIKLKL